MRVVDAVITGESKRAVIYLDDVVVGVSREVAVEDEIDCRLVRTILDDNDFTRYVEARGVADCLVKRIKRSG